MGQAPKKGFSLTLRECRKDAEKWLTRGMYNRKCLQKVPLLIAYKNCQK